MFDLDGISHPVQNASIFREFQSVLWLNSTKKLYKALILMIHSSETREKFQYQLPSERSLIPFPFAIIIWDFPVNHALFMLFQRKENYICLWSILRKNNLNAVPTNWKPKHIQNPSKSNFKVLGISSFFLYLNMQIQIFIKIELCFSYVVKLEN